MSALVSIRNVVKSYVRGKQSVEVLHGSTSTWKRANSSR